MDIQNDLLPILQSQYQAALDMLSRLVVQCPEPMWNDPRPQNKFWHVAYHALHFTHLYLHPALQDYTPWAGYRDQYEFLGRLPWPPHDLPAIGEPYRREDVLEFAGFLGRRAPEMLAGLDFAAGSGFPWLPFSKLELQVYNIRHLQQHTGELSERLGAQAGLEVVWVGQYPGQD